MSSIRNFFSKTPILLLIIFLGAVSIGTAYAITITLGGDVIATNDLTVDGHVNIQNGATILDHVTVGDGITTSAINVGMIYTNNLSVGTNNANNDDTVFFDDGTEFLMWDESENDFVLSGNLQTSGDFIADDLIINDQATLTNLDVGNCVGCMKYYSLTKPTEELVTGTNTHSCDAGDLVISGGGWVPGTTSWLRESWAIDDITWKIHFTDVNGAGVKPGAFKITCADFSPFHSP